MVVLISCLVGPSIMGNESKNKIKMNTNSSTHISLLKSYLEYLIHDTLSKNKDDEHKIMTKARNYIMV